MRQYWSTLYRRYRYVIDPPYAHYFPPRSLEVNRRGRLKDLHLLIIFFKGKMFNPEKKISFIV